MIVIEGVDNSGKSTLALQLSKDLGLSVMHSIRPESNDEQANYLACLGQLKYPEVPFIRDRVSVISELVYGPLLRGRSLLGQYHAGALRSFMGSTTPVIYCRPPDATILDNRGRDQMEGVLTEHEALTKKYDLVFEDLARFSTLNIHRYDWTDRLAYDQVLQFCREHLKRINAISQSVWFLEAL